LRSGFGSKAEEIEWRRSKIIELKSQGLDQREIAKILQVTPTLISYDVQYMRNEARDNLKDYTTRELPLQFRVAVRATWNAIKEYWNISQNTRDNREKMQALEQYLECHRKLCSMLGYEPTLQSFFADGNNIVDNNDPDYRHSHDENTGRHYAEGEMIFPEGSGPYVYTSTLEHLKHCNEKHDITEQQVEGFKTKYYDVKDKDIEEVKARWWCYNGNNKSNGNDDKTKETIPT
jgi:predicted transcriptional regulator